MSSIVNQYKIKVELAGLFRKNDWNFRDPFRPVWGRQGRLFFSPRNISIPLR